MEMKDKLILQLLQTDASLSAEQIGDQVGLSAMATWRRIKRMEDERFITQRVVLLDAQKTGRPVIAFVHLRSRQHGKEWFQNLAQAVEQMPEVQEFYRMSGEIDFLLKVRLRDLDDYRHFYNALTSKIDLLDVSTSFAFETLKYSTAIPLD
jgi:Lrp/AsnC family transcriptional regulator